MVEFSSASPGILFPQNLESWELDSLHSGCLLRLRKLLVAASGFRLVLLEFNDPRYRDRIIRQVDGFPVKTAALVLDESVDSFDEFERRLSALAGQCQAVHVLNLERWLADDKTRESRFKGFNYHREALAERCPFTLLLWMIAPDIKAFALKAPDLWAWRTDVFDFSSRHAPISAPVVERNVVRGSASARERQERIAEIEAYLDRELRKDGSGALLLTELGQLHGDLGHPDAALRTLERALAIFRETDDRRQAAMARGLMADIEAARGNTDEALETYREIMKLFEELGDVRSRAVTLGQIADVLEARGELEEALWIRREEQLPVYERLGDVRSRAVTLGKIADVLQARGELEEALRIRREEQLPVYERLGDVRARAVTLGKIADVLQARGELDEALRIFREDVLPAFERLRSARDVLVCRAKIGITYLARGAAGDREKALELLNLALQDAQRLKLPEAGQIAGIIRRAENPPESG